MPQQELLEAPLAAAAAFCANSLADGRRLVGSLSERLPRAPRDARSLPAKETVVRAARRRGAGASG